MPVDTTSKPRQRTRFRRRLGRIFYIWKRRLTWIFGAEKWAKRRETPFEITVFEHQTPLLRQLRALDMYLQVNKVTNLRLAAEKIDGIVIRPGETFSFWYLVGNPVARKGYLEGLVLDNGQLRKGIGGGLCQMGNLIYWMALHTPLTVVERWRHSYDVFPDAGRKLPFGSGATLAYNYIDLQIRNDTQVDFQICVHLTETDLLGAIRSLEMPEHFYEVFESEHFMRHEPWGGYSRHNRITRRVFERQSGALLHEEPVTENHALMMYQPFVEGGIFIVDEG
jgi:vancomycin resistance protein VanW